MKAEHRKELQTNVLADRVGRFLQGIRTKGHENSRLVIVIILALVAVGLIWFYFGTASKKARSQMWVSMDEVTSEMQSAIMKGRTAPKTDVLKPTLKQLEETIDEHPGTKVALMARFQIARIYLHDQGIDMLFGRLGPALKNIRSARTKYEELAEEVKEDPYWKPQALLGEARCVETLAIDDIDNLDKAEELYAALAKKYPKSAAGRAATARLKQLKDKSQRAEIAQFYKDLGRELGAKFVR